MGLRDDKATPDKVDSGGREDRRGRGVPLRTRVRTTGCRCRRLGQSRGRTEGSVVPPSKPGGSWSSVMSDTPNPKEFDARHDRYNKPPNGGDQRVPGTARHRSRFHLHQSSTFGGDLLVCKARAGAHIRHRFRAWLVREGKCRCPVTSSETHGHGPCKTARELPARRTFHIPSPTLKSLALLAFQVHENAARFKQLAGESHLDRMTAIAEFELRISE